MDDQFIADYSTTGRNFTFKVTFGSEEVVLLNSGNINGGIVAVGLFVKSHGLPPDKPKTVLFWVICARKNKMWLADYVTFKCDNYDDLCEQINESMKGSVYYSPKNPEPVQTRALDHKCYRGTNFFFAVEGARVSVKKNQLDGGMLSVILFDQNDCAKSRTEFEVGDICTIGSFPIRSSKKQPAHK